MPLIDRFRRKKTLNQNERSQILKTTGLDYNTCKPATEAGFHDPKFLPLPPPRRPVTPIEFDDKRRDQTSDHLLPNPQTQSHFFRLPWHVRESIYWCLWSEHFIHLEFMNYWPLSYYRGNGKKSKEPYWHWWHRICPYLSIDGDSRQRVDPYPDGSRPIVGWVDICHREDRRLKKEEASKHKLKGVFEWLQTCRLGYWEALPILYQTNTFLFESPRNLARMPKLLAPSRIHLIRSLSVSFIAETPATGDMLFILESSWKEYNAMLRSLKQSFIGLDSLRLEIFITPSYRATYRMNAEEETKWFPPLIELARSREWKKFQLGVSEMLPSYQAALERVVAKEGVDVDIIMLRDIFPPPSDLAWSI